MAHNRADAPDLGKDVSVAVEVSASFEETLLSTLGCSRLLYGFTAAQMDSSSHFLSVVFHWLIQAVASGMQHIHGKLVKTLKISVAEISRQEDCFVKTRLLIAPDN